MRVGGVPLVSWCCDQGIPPPTLAVGPTDNHFFIHFLRFGSKPCCYDDLSTFIPLLSAKQKAEFLKEARSVTEAEPIDHTPSDEDLKKNVRI